MTKEQTTILTYLRNTCLSRAIDCENFAAKSDKDGFHNDCILYNGKEQAYRECAELVEVILKNY